MNTQSIIVEKAKRIIADKLGLDEGKVTPNARFMEDLGADSLDVIDTIMHLEKDLAISIPDEVVERIRTVGDLFQYIEKHTGATAHVQVS